MNPFHVKEFYFDKLNSLLRRHFATVSIFENTLSSPFETGRRMNEGRRRRGHVGIEPGSRPAM